MTSNTSYTSQIDLMISIIHEAKTNEFKVQWLNLCWRRIIRQDELGEAFLVRPIVRSCINTGRWTNYPSKRTICLGRLEGLTNVNNSSGWIIRPCVQDRL